MCIYMYVYTHFLFFPSHFAQPSSLNQVSQKLEHPPRVHRSVGVLGDFPAAGLRSDRRCVAPCEGGVLLGESVLKMSEWVWRGS